MKSNNKDDILSSLKQFTKDIGAPEAIICDGSEEQTATEVNKYCGDIGTTLRIIEESTPWSNKSELYIGLIKGSVRKDTKETDIPPFLWCYCAERRSLIINLTAKKLFQLHGSTLHTALTSEEGDISNLCQFKYYDWCYHRDNKAKFPFNRELLGRIIEPAKG